MFAVLYIVARQLRLCGPNNGAQLAPRVVHPCGPLLVGRQVGRQAGRQAGREAGRHAGKQAGRGMNTTRIHLALGLEAGKSKRGHSDFGGVVIIYHLRVDRSVIFTVSWGPRFLGEGSLWLRSCFQEEIPKPVGGLPRASRRLVSASLALNLRIENCIKEATK